MAPAAANACYLATNFYVNRIGDFQPCGTSSEITQCCGSDDFCLQDGICYAGAVNSNLTGYYIGGCTDPTFQDPSCPKICLPEWTSDIVYNNTQSKWFCCNNKGSLDCKHPSTISVDAPAPSAIATVGKIGPATTKIPNSSVGAYNATKSTSTRLSSTSVILSSGSSVAISATPGSVIPDSRASNSATTSPVPSAATSPGLSGGAIAGIVIGVLAGIAIIAVVTALFYIRRKRRRELDATMPAKESRYYAEMPGVQDAKSSIQAPQELDASSSPAELATKDNSPVANMPPRGSLAKDPPT